MWDIAPQFNAMLVFAEHRYYGKSMPFGADSYKNKTVLNFLTSEQALADFAEIINFIKSTVPGAAGSRVVAFGGSYGGMLSAWFRIKYPNIVVG
ncbi:lysosomal Pro-X carboxypeptidase, partial [Elysia marginata]